MALVAEKPGTEPVVRKRLDSLRSTWDELESLTQNKAQCLFNANRAELFSQSCAELDGWLSAIETRLSSDDFGKDLTSVNILLNRHQVGEEHAPVVHPPPAPDHVPLSSGAGESGRGEEEGGRGAAGSGPSARSRGRGGSGRGRPTVPPCGGNVHSSAGATHGAPEPSQRLQRDPPV